MGSLISLSIFIPYILGIFYKGGIGLLAHLVFFFGIGIAGIIVSYVIKHKLLRIKPLPTLENLLIFTTIFFFSLSLIFSQTKNVGFLETSDIYAGMILILIGYSIHNNKKHINKLFYFLTFILLISLLIGYYSYFSFPFERFAGSFNNFLEPWSAFPNAMGDFLLLNIPLAFYLIETRKKKKRNILQYLPDLTIILSISALILSESQGTYIVAIILFFLLLRRGILINKCVKQILILTIIGVVLGFSFSTIKNNYEFNYRETVQSELSTTQFENISSVNKRLEHFKVGVGLFIKAPILGYGAGSYPYISANKVSFLNQADHPHNLFLKIGIENGLLALISYISLIMTILIRTIMLTKQKLDPIRELVFLGVFTFLIHQIIDYNLNFTSISFIFYLLLGILTVNYKKVFKHKAIPYINSINFIVYILISLLLIFFSFHELSIYTKSKTFYNSNSLYANQEQLIKKGLNLNPYNAKLYALNKDYKTAYKLDPNNLVYLLGMYEQSSKFERENMKVMVSNKLHMYLSLLKTNTHFTILSDNPYAAISLAILIQDNKLADELKKATQNEKRKFSLIYNLSLN